MTENTRQAHETHYHAGSNDPGYMPDNPAGDDQ